MPPSKKPKKYHFTKDELERLVYEAVGAASVPLWQAHPNDVFPSEAVVSRVSQVLKDHGV